MKEAKWGEILQELELPVNQINWKKIVMFIHGHRGLKHLLNTLDSTALIKSQTLVGKIYSRIRTQSRGSIERSWK